MEFSVKQIAEILGGTVAGDAEAKINQLSKIEEGVPQSLSFLASPQYEQYIYTTKATAVIVDKKFVPEKQISVILIKVDDPKTSFVKLLETYNQIKLNKEGIEQPVFISRTAKYGQNIYLGSFSHLGENTKIGNGVKIYPNCYVGDNVTIGDNTTLFAGTKIYSDCAIGANCTLHSGVIIGGDGFGFTPNSENNYNKIPQIGNVIIEDNVEIGSNTTIDRATLGSTIIRRGVKLDNLIQIAHNVEVGENTVIASQAGVAGSTKIGKNCMIGGQVGIVGHLIIADGVKIAAQSGVGSSILKENEIVQGSPAFPVNNYRRSYVLFRKLPDLANQIEELRKHNPG